MHTPPLPLAASPYPLTVIAGCSGAGKDTLVALLKTEAAAQGLPLQKTISATTRSPRAGEVDGEHYHFLSPDAFQQAVEAGEFVEWAAFSGNCYGTLLSELTAKLSRGPVLLVIELEGVHSLKQLQAAGRLQAPFKSIFISPEGFPLRGDSAEPLSGEALDAALEPVLSRIVQRLATRQSESESVQRERVLQARQELLRVYLDQYQPLAPALPLVDAVFINHTTSDEAARRALALALMQCVATVHGRCLSPS